LIENCHWGTPLQIKSDHQLYGLITYLKIFD
jgi:hypothetical protein